MINGSWLVLTDVEQLSVEKTSCELSYSHELQQKTETITTATATTTDVEQLSIEKTSQKCPVAISYNKTTK